MKFRNLPMRMKLLGGFITMAVIVMVVATLSLAALGRSNDRLTDFINGASQRQQLAADLRAGVARRAIAVRNMVLVSEPAERELEKTAAITAHRDVLARMAQLKTSIAADPSATAKNREIFASIEQIEALYAPVALDIVKLAAEGKIAEATLRIDKDCRPLLVKLLDATTAFVVSEQEASASIATSADESYQAERIRLAAASLFAIAIAIALGWWLSHAVTGRLTRAVALAEAVAAGNLSTTIVVDSTDETGLLLSALQRMNTSLVGTVDRVRQSADGIATASAEIAMGNQDLSSRTEQQASALQQTAAAMQQMTSSVQQNADNSRQASQLSTSTAEAAGRAGKAVHQIVATMGEISASSNKISDIIGVIDGIAFQTNILALNAAVEAARAGEQGRGFAVVASEVRSLAQRSAQAAREIKGLIGDSASKVAAGSELVGQAGLTMDEVLSQVRRMTDLIAEIHASTDHQSTGILEVNQAVASIDQGTQQNAALVEESAAAAESLRDQAAVLLQAIAVFKTRPQNQDHHLLMA